MTGLYEALIKKFQELLETKTPEKAAAIIKKEYYSTGPDRKNLKKSVREFRKNYKVLPETMKASKTELKQKMKHMDACFDAILEDTKEVAMKRVLLQNTIEQQLKSANVVLKENQTVDDFRCLHDLMHLENTPEAELHNNQVVSLMLYNQGLIEEEQFRKLRTGQLDKAKKPGKDLVDSEVKDKKKALVNLVRDEVTSLKKKAEGAENLVSDILNVNENDPEKLKKAYRAIGASHSYLFDTGERMFSTSTYGWDKTATEDEKKWAKENLDKFGTENECKYYVTPVIANPYSAIISPEDIIDYMQSHRGSVSNVEADDFSLVVQYVGDTGKLWNEYMVQIAQNNTNYEKGKLEKAGMSGAKSIPYGHGLTVYKKDEDVLITKNEIKSWVPCTVELREAKPNELLKEKLSSEIIETLEQYKERNKWKSSKTFNELERSLNAVRDMSGNIKEDITKEDLEQYRNVFKELQSKANAYLEHKEKDFRKRNIPEPEGGYKKHSRLAKSDYEKKRILLAESILKFTKKKMEVLDLTGKYIDTLEKKKDLLQEKKNVKNGNEAKNENEFRRNATLTNINELENEKGNPTGEKNKGVQRPRANSQGFDRKKESGLSLNK